MKQHPEDSIFKVKDFINELSKVQDTYFNNLCRDLALEDGVVKDHLFDYVYNEDKMMTFGEYLDKIGQGDLWDWL